ncbi:MAG: hypothetical protein ACLP5H_08420 [Desulfomonilaceae bacterium]
MLRNALKYVFVLTLMVTAFSAAAFAESTQATYDPCTGASGYKAISKVKPPPAPAPTALKVKPWGLTSRFEALSKYNPVNWWADCCLPMPAKGQFVIAPRVFFARVAGEARRGTDITGVQTAVVNFDDHLGFKKSGNAIWSINALYQIRPRWGIRYSFSPMVMEATNSPTTAFSFAGQTFAAGNPVHSKWERYEHRAGLVFTLSRTNYSSTNFFAEWLNVQDKLTIGGAAGTTFAVTMNDTKNMAVTGLEFDKCLKNYHGNTLALSGRGSIAFLNDSIGYDAEAALSYLIPIKTGRFGFVKGGYRYASLKKDRPNRMFNTSLDGPFVQVGFLF